MPTYQIFTNKPIPPRYNLRKGRSKYPFAQLQVGQSFEIPADTPKQRNHLQVMAGVYARALGIKVTTRTMPNGKAVGIWRVG